MRGRMQADPPGLVAAGPGAVDADIWSRPWMDPWRSVGQRVADDIAQGAPVWQALARQAPAPVRFVPHTDLPAGVPYEAFIASTACCPTREGWHDLFNGLCWSVFPATKRRLNQLQSAHIAQDGIGATRGAVRDALTVFDENAALLRAPDALWDALAAKQWPQVFGTLRPLWSQSRLVVFGHALLEKLMLPRKPVTAHVFRVRAGSDDLAEWDAQVALALDAGRLAGRPFAHLPVLGVPGWWSPNQEPGFYQDPLVFRPASPRARCGQ
jgi:hypothetical protein